MKRKPPFEIYNQVNITYGDKTMSGLSSLKTVAHDEQRSERSLIVTDELSARIENTLRGDHRLTVGKLSAIIPQISRSQLHEAIAKILEYQS